MEAVRVSGFAGERELGERKNVLLIRAVSFSSADILRLLGVSLLGWKEALSFGAAVEGSVFLSEY